MVKISYNCSLNEATSHSPFEVMYGLHPSTPIDRLLPFVGDTAEAVDILTMIANIKDVVF